MIWHNCWSQTIALADTREQYHKQHRTSHHAGFQHGELSIDDNLTSLAYQKHTKPDNASYTQHYHCPHIACFVCNHHAQKLAMP